MVVDKAHARFAEQLHELWHTLYGNNKNYEQSLNWLNDLINDCEEAKARVQQGYQEKQSTYHEKPVAWHQKSIVYSAYVDLFNADFTGLTERLPKLQELGISCLWLLPVFASPMKDMGFDISDYFEVRRSILPRDVRDRDVERQMAAIRAFMADAHSHGIDVLFDVALNHSSIQHEWFDEELAAMRDGMAIDEENNRYIWSDTTEKYKDAPIIFSDTETSNWQKIDDKRTLYYFHRFYQYQPDLNYKNPRILSDITAMFVYWLSNGIDGLRLDAIPHLWKEEHTTCDNLPQVHTVVKFLRVAFDYVAPNTLVLAEANLQPSELVKYFGTGDECTAAYHFPLTAKVYQSMAIQSFAPIKDALSKESTPDIPSNCAWFFFLRCHDEMNLHLFNEEERKFMFNFYCHDEKWQFRKHTGISARVSDLLMYDENWIHMANSILLTACGTPIIYYGDEYAKKIDNEYYEERFRKTGIVDSRNYCRGRIAWASVDSELKDPNTLCYKVFNHLKRMLKVRTMYPWLGSTRTVQFVEIMDTLGRLLQNMLVFVRTNGKESLVFFHNLSDKPCDFVMPFRMLHFTGTDYTIFKQGEEATDLLGEPIIYVDEKQGVVRIKERGHLWLKKPVQEKSVYLC